MRVTSLPQDNAQDFSKATKKLKNHIYDYLTCRSTIENNFVKALDISNEVVVYAKLPNGFKIPTPVGDYTLTGLFLLRKAKVNPCEFDQKLAEFQFQNLVENVRWLQDAEAKKVLEQLTCDCMKESLQIIYINGPSSSGKTTLAKALQQEFVQPFYWNRSSDW